MSLTFQNTFTLGDLSKIVLGPGELTSEHLSVLQSLLTILLQKLNCHNEIVRIHGFPAKCIQKLLDDKPNNSRYQFQFEANSSFPQKYELLEEMEIKVQEIDLKMQQHFEQIRDCHKTKIFSAQKWDFYASPTEDLCTLYMRHNKEFCLLARNSIFNKELRSRVVPLITERFNQFEAKLENMRSELKEIIQLGDKTSAKLNCIEFLVKDIENIRSLLNKNAIDFRATMLEIQEMLNCKLHRVALPALKKYLEERFAKIRKHLRALERVSSKCSPTEALKIRDKKTCLSCSRHQDQDKLNKNFQTLRSIDERKNCFCCNLLKEPTIVEKMDRMKLVGNVLNAAFVPAARRSYGQKKIGILTS